MIATTSRSSASIPVRYYIISLLLPLSILLVLRAIPQIDLTFNSPAAHFYVVTAVSFMGIVLSGLANTLARVSNRAQVLFVSLGMFSVAGLLFIHGLATAGALLPEPTPGAGWSAKLSLVVGGFFFVLSGINWPASINATLVKHYRTVIAAAWLMYAVFFLVVFSFPQQLAVLDQAGEGLVALTLYAAIGLYALGLIIYIFRLRSKPGVSDAFIALGLLLFSSAVATQTWGIRWNVSWWSYHFLIGLAIIIITIGLNREYGQLRPSSLLRRYLVFGLTTIMLLALFASEIFFRINRENLANERERSAIQVATHLTTQLQNDIPEAMTLDGLESIASSDMLQHVLDHNLEGLDIIRLKLYDSLGKIVFSTASSTTGQAQANAALLSALSGTPQSNVEEGTELESSGEPQLKGQILETYVPLRDVNGQIIGAVEIYQDASDLQTVAVQQRGQFLITVSILMGLIFFSFAWIVQRADRNLASRAQELKDVQAALVQSEHTRQDITHVVTSNVRRPLTTLTRSLDQLQRSALSPDQAELLSRARSHTREVNNTVYNLLNISQIENNELHLQQSTFAINELLQLNVQESAEAAREAEVTLATEARPGLPYVWADRDLINRVISNLLTNAIAHTPRGGQVLINADADPDGYVIVRVKDQGEGITPEDQTRLFEKFTRLTNDPSADGTGLGLAFCKLTIEQHQGRIWVDSTPGRGSTFTFTLPTLTTATAI